MRSSSCSSQVAVVAAVVACLALAVVPVFAQSATGRVTGVVKDTSGAVIVGAMVTVTNVDTQARSETTSGPDGTYQVLQLPVGAYTVTVRHQGFEAAVTKPDTLQINQTLRVDVVMALGATTSTITVADVATQVETVNPTIGGTVTGPEVQELPLNGRDPMSLIAIQPGVSGGVGGGTGASIAGGRNDNVTFLLDGGENNVVRSSGLNLDPNPDAVEEFRVLMNNYGAEYGRSGGGTVSVVTKSGTNTFHGTLFDYVRNTDFNANNFFLNMEGQPRPILQRNQFGGTFGGPILIPKIINGRNKLFFFFAYQGQKQNQTAVGSQTSVFTPQEIQGNFSQADNGRPDPNVAAFLQQYPYFQPNPTMAAQAIIAPATLSPVFQNLVKAGLIVNTTSGTILPAQPTKTNYTQYTGKSDYFITPTDRVSATIGYQSNPTLSAGNIGFPLSSYTENLYALLDYTKTIRPNLLNDVRGSVTRLRTHGNNPTTVTPGPQELGIEINPDVTLGSPEISMPAGYESLGYNPCNSDLTDNQFEVADTVTWVKGNETIKAGFSLTDEQENSIYNFQTMGDFTFGGAATSIGSGNPLADLAMGLPDSFSQYPSAVSNMRSRIYAAFVQDEWKVTRKLLLTLGMRYEYQTPQTDTQGRSFAIEPGVQSKRFVSAPVGAVFPGDPGAPKGLYFPDYNDWAPRFGVAWDPFGDGKTSIRAGFGIFHNILNGWTQDENNGVPPFYAGVSYSSNNGNPLTSISSAPLYMTNPYAANGEPNPFPSHATLSSSDPNLLAELGDLPFGNADWFAKLHLRTPYIYQYNFSIQRQLVRDLVLDVSYVGSDSHKLTNMEDGNPIILGTTTRLLNVGLYPYYNSPTLGLTDNGFAALPETITNDGSANYNGLLTSLTKRFSDTKGIGNTFMTLAYTWSHNLDNGTGAITNTTGDIPYYNHHALVGNSAYDQRQRFTIAGGWEIPFAKAWSSGPKRLTNGWTVYPIFSDYTGTPFSISAGLRENSPVENKAGASGAGDNQLTNALINTSLMHIYNPHTTQTIVVGTTSRTGLYYFNPNAFTVPSTWNSASYIPTAAQRTYGMGRDSIPGIGIVNLDLALAKRTQIFERLNTEFRAEAFNSLNHTEFANPVTSRTSPTFGQVTSVLANRVMQLALRLTF